MTMAPAVLLVLMGVPAGSEPPRTPIVAQTGEPVLIHWPSQRWGVPLAQYREMAKAAAQRPDFVGMEHPPEGLGPKALFGYNLNVGGRNASWVIDDARKTFYADLNTNGDLRDDPPLRFQNENGRKVARLKAPVRFKDGGSQPLEWKLVLLQPETGAVGFEIHDDAFRRGTLRLPDRELAFQLRGAAGFYDRPEEDRVAFDLDGDGRPGTSEDEIYAVSERYLTVGKQSYEFVVDRYGRSLTLQPLAEYRPPRPRVAIGAPAPDFSAKDLDGKTVRLADYRGKVVLLDFWSVHCGPCVAEAPKLSGTYHRYRDRGFEIVGINAGDELSELKEFAGKHRMPWRQVRQAPTEELWNLYRARGFPVYFLIGRDGTLVAMSEEIRGQGGLDHLEGLLEKHLGR